MDLETAKKSLKTKLTLLKLNVKRTGDILQGEQPDAIERHCKALKAVVAAIDDCRRAVEEQKIIAEESLEEINEWNIEINAKLAEADNDVKRMKECRQREQAANASKKRENAKNKSNTRRNYTRQE